MRFSDEDPDLLVCTSRGTTLDAIAVLVDLSEIQPISSTRLPFEEALQAAQYTVPGVYLPTGQAVDEAF